MKGKYLNLRSEIIRAGFTCYNVAEAIGISPQALSQKMNGYSLFSAEEIARIGRLLNINKDDYYTIFIANKSIRCRILAPYKIARLIIS